MIPTGTPRTATCHVLGAIGVALAITSSSARAQPSPARATLVGARQLLEAGSYAQAESTYASVLVLVPRTDSTLRAAAHFGRAFAAQQRFVAGDTADRRIDPDSLVADYRQAATLNPSALGAASQENIAAVLAAAGRHAQAAAAFLSLATEARVGDRASSYHLNAGREFEAAGDAPSALEAYRMAFKVASRNADARRALLEYLVRSRPAREVLGQVALYSDSASARDVSNALVALLTRREPALEPNDATDATIELARTWPRMQMGAPYFDVALREPLTIAARLQSSVRPGLLAMIEAYSRPKNQAYKESANAGWWHSDDDSPTGKTAAWRALLRSIGDWYYQQGSFNVARSYYEASIGVRQHPLTARSIDRAALLPLALIYAQASDSSGTSELHSELREFTAIIFSAKNDAYRAGDLQQIRDFHITLGALYAARGQWSGPGAQNAEFQIEHMQQATRAMRERTPNVTLVDPPDLLEKLAIHYKLTGRPADATRVKQDVVRQYERLQRPEDAAAAARRIDTARVIPRSLLKPGR